MRHPRLSRGPRLPDEHLVTLAPGGTYKFEPNLEHQVSFPGEYTLSFEYSFHPTPPKRLGTVPPELLLPPPIKYPDGLWIGTAKSNEIKKVLMPDLRSSAR